MPETRSTSTKSTSTKVQQEPQEIRAPEVHETTVELPITYKPPQTNQIATPVVKKYTINFTGVGNVTFSKHLFEDILPLQPVKMNRMTTISERSVLLNYLRSVLIKRGDGEQVTIEDRRNPNIVNLLSYMKVLEINPYHFSRITENPYETLPDNFAMFNSCYPIKYDVKEKTVSCSPDSISTNIRVYSLNLYDYLADTIDNSGLQKKFSDAWREIEFYKFVREEIIKKKISPNFPILFTYYVAENDGINFDGMKALKSRTIDPSTMEFENENDKIKKFVFNDTIMRMFGKTQTTLEKMKKDKPQLDARVKAFENAKRDTQILFGSTGNKIMASIKYEDGKKKLTPSDELDFNLRSNRAIVAVTEAPNQNIINWSSRTYTLDGLTGPVKTQISTGVHDVLTWKSVIFQIYSAFYVMFMKKITIRNMQWSTNVFIKTLTGTSQGAWKYKISNVDFYVPNTGFLVLIDSSFGDISRDYKSPYTHSEIDTFTFKHVGNLYNDRDGHEVFGTKTVHTSAGNNVDEVLAENFTNLFSENIFNGEFSQYGGIRPPEEIVDLIRNISERGFEHISKNFPDTFTEFFPEFLHNKVGSPIAEGEMNMKLYEAGSGIEKCKRGNMIGIRLNHSTNSFILGIFLGRKFIENQNIPNGFSSVLTIDLDNPDLDNKVFTIQEVSDTDIARIYGTVKQEYKMDRKYTAEDEVLETYIM